jgi:glycosyltransferase involved in cell wall biosynthesis
MSTSFLKIVIVGPAYPYRGGGITTFNERLAEALQAEGHQVRICNFTLQYPSFLFPGKSQYADRPAPKGLQIDRQLHALSPLNWWRLGKALQKEKPDLILVRFWLPFFGPAFGTVLRQAKKNGHTRVLAITDNVIPHEKRIGDKPFTQYFLNACDGFITMSEKVKTDLESFHPSQPIAVLPHPLYDHFGERVEKGQAKALLQLPADKKILLFFGFIRAYKGLDLLLEAVGLLKQQQRLPEDFFLLVAGEFYEAEEPYRQIIDRYQLADIVRLDADFIPDDRVRYYFSAADGVIQPYKHATQSGVTPLAYHFEIPMIVTRVGALPDYVPEGRVGLVSEPTVSAIADAIAAFYEKGTAQFMPGLLEEKNRYSWKRFTESILQLFARV